MEIEMPTWMGWLYFSVHSWKIWLSYSLSMFHGVKWELPEWHYGTQSKYSVDVLLFSQRGVFSYWPMPHYYLSFQQSSELPPDIMGRTPLQSDFDFITCFLFVCTTVLHNVWTEPPQKMDPHIKWIYIIVSLMLLAWLVYLFIYVLQEKFSE